MKNWLVKILAACLVVCLAAGPGVSPAAAAAPGPADPAELAAFLDGVLSSYMADHHIPGAVVAVVKDGSPLLSKGYGFADLEQRKPVDPARTLFRPGSVSKLFTWTAVMQLVEQGKLDLDADVNTYLDFSIPATFAQPITLKHLMTHTPGFEDVSTDLFKLRREEVMSLEVYLKTHVPTRVFSPGTLGAYSNYGTALAGYIVERTAGMPFAEYVERNIFAPLGMEHSTFRQPLPEALAADMANGYNYSNGAYAVGQYEFVPAYPAGSLSASADDMTRFMIAHLQNGRYGDVRILQEETARQMHARLFSHDPRLDGMAYGFFEDTLNGVRIISHGGDTILFHTGLFLLPEQNVGLFVSCNGTGGGDLGKALLKAFLDHYYPVQQAAAPLMPPEGFAGRIAPYLGEYIPARSNFTTPEKLFAVFTPISASLNEEGYLVMSMAGQAMQFVEVEPGLLQERYNPDNRIVYQTGADGQRYLLPTLPFAFIQVPWYGGPTFHLLLLVVGLLLCVASPLGWLIAWLEGLRQRQPVPWTWRLARWLATFFCLGFLLFVVILGGVMMDLLPGFGMPRIVFEDVPQMAFLAALTPFLGLASLGMLLMSVLAWVKRYWRLGGRIHYSLLTLSALALVWAMVYWNLLL